MQIFGSRYQDTSLQCFRFLSEVDRKKLTSIIVLKFKQYPAVGQVSLGITC